MMVSAVARALRSEQEVGDAAIDFWLSAPYRQVAGRFWTPVAVARTAARWMVESGAVRVLDVGSGAGKFCVVAALATDLRITGIEQRRRLVVEATNLARRFRVERRCELLLGTLARVDLALFDALYVFNSFAENVYPRTEQLDDSVELSARRMRRDLLKVEEGLARMAVGSVLVTYHGFGGQIPDTFELVREETAGTGMLRLWAKRRSLSGGRSWVEVADEVMDVGDTAPR